MASLREIKDRINSVRNTLKITSAMKMVASAKLHKAQSAIAGKIPYEQKLHHILAGLLRDDDLVKALHDEFGFGKDDASLVLEDISRNALPDKENAPRIAIVAFSSNSSLCGGFNANLIRRFNEVMGQLEDGGYAPQDIDIYTVGKKIREQVLKSGYEVKADFQHLADKQVVADSDVLAEMLVDSFMSQEVSQVIFLYSHYASMGSQPVLLENYLPLPLHDYTTDDEPIDFLVEPDPIYLVKKLLPKVLYLKMYTVLLDAAAAEHAARMVAMQVASDNAQDLIAELSLAYNKGRQQEITAEILDLVGGSMN